MKLPGSEPDFFLSKTSYIWEWDDDDIPFVLDKRDHFDFYSATCSSLQQQSTGRHVALLGITYIQSFSCSLVLFTRNHIPPVFLLLISAVYSGSHTSSLSLAHLCCSLGITYPQSFSCSLVLFSRDQIPPVFLLLISAAWLVEKQQIPNF